MTRTSCLLHLYTHSNCRVTRTSCILYLYTHSDCRMTLSRIVFLYTVYVGPFTDAVRLMDDPDARKIVQPSAGIHIVLPEYYSPRNMGLLDPSTSDGRVIFFLPWQGTMVYVHNTVNCECLNWSLLPIIACMAISNVSSIRQIQQPPPPTLLTIASCF